jgi:hypothetical protein
MATFEQEKSARESLKATDHQINERMMARWTCLVGVFTFLLVIVGGITAWIMWKTDQTSKLRDRAFLYFTDIESKQFPIKDPLNNLFIFHIENSGNMPARRVSIIYSCPSFPNGESIPQFMSDFLIPVQVPNVIGPKQSLTFPGCTYSLSTLDELKKGTTHLAIFLEATYLDGFDSKITRITQLCQFVNIDSDGKIFYHFYGPHNCTDEDCPKDDSIAKLKKQNMIAMWKKCETQGPIIKK